MARGHCWRGLALWAAETRLEYHPPLPPFPFILRACLPGRLCLAAARGPRWLPPSCWRLCYTVTARHPAVESGVGDLAGPPCLQPAPNLSGWMQRREGHTSILESQRRRVKLTSAGPLPGPRVLLRARLRGAPFPPGPVTLVLRMSPAGGT